MDENKILLVQSLLYDDTTNEIQAVISKTEDPDILYMYAYNYNWDDGFEIPQLILDNNKCNLSIALLIFYSADGVQFLLNKVYDESVNQWYSFIKKLYNAIITGKYQQEEIAFKVPLSKVELYKLKKTLNEQGNLFNENSIFFKDIEGKNLDVNL